MQHRLTCTFSTVDAYVEARDRRVGLLDSGAKSLNELVGVFLLFARHREEVLDMPNGKDQHMAFGNGVLVGNRQDRSTSLQYFRCDVRRAEGT